MPHADFNLLAKDVETVELQQDAVLARSGKPVEHIFFPNSGAISLMVNMANGQTVATAMLGREAVIGSLRVFGPAVSGITAIVQVPGTALRVPAARFEAAFNRSSAVRYVVQLHIRAILVQLQHGAACNALPPS
ncbi:MULTISPECIES: Crp/Fnr family transcriptional regulator [Bradyrhizobium]|uniref:Crp/Fnr family transcriptional regulator n=1 Tax=Bradyrhizobium TaxID=374 RepID=UPI001E3300BF|nr:MULTISPECIES: Crp/Fnr family transcriptional regulator [Bradyrhizobium]